MQCPNCKEEIKQGYLYCENCGEEIRIVPDFEPEIENSIIETLSAVAEDVQPDSEAGLVSKHSTEQEAEESIGVESLKKVGNRILLALLFFVLFVVVVFRFGGSSSVFHEEIYPKDQIENAQKAYSNKDYEAAAGYYEAAMKYEKTAELLTGYADCLYEMGRIEQAISNYYAAIDLEPDNEMAYARIIALYEKDDEYQAIYDLLTASESEQIKAAFQVYMADDPVFSYAEGTYEQVVPLKITAATNGDIYYTLNGTDPMTNGVLYTSPIFLKNGNYNVKAVYINDYGICSNVIEARFTIDGTQPDPPVIELQSGQYTLPQMITVIPPADCTVYYTTDGSTPDENSFIYGEPIPMKEGVTNYRFVALSKDGVYSEIEARSYQLTVETTLSAEESVYRLKHRLLERNMILDLEGSLATMRGKNIYVYNSLQIIEDKIMHVIYEYYQEGNNRNMTGKIYCIDVSNGYVYKIVKDDNGNDVLDPI